ncbi:MAG: response regulator [Nitrospinota bacterium]
MTHAMTDNGKILIFDSDTTAVQSLKQSAEKFGFHCISASNSLETIDLVSKERPDIIFTDFPLRGDNGFSLLEEVKDLILIRIF